MLEKTREREMVETLGEVTAHTLQRYVWAADRVAESNWVLDASCGCGYGSRVLSWGCEKVVGVDYSKEAIEAAKRCFASPAIEFFERDLNTYEFEDYEKFNAVVSLETIEHLTNPKHFLEQCYYSLMDGGKLIVSVPNEDVLKHEELVATGHTFHQKHYTLSDITKLISECGFHVDGVYSQLNVTDANTCVILPVSLGFVLLVEATK